MASPRTAESDDEALLWSAWRENGDREARACLVNRYLWLARSVALKVFLERESTDDLDSRDLLQSATVGLIEAVDRFDRTKGVEFSGYAKKRIRGAVIDGVNSSSDIRAQLAAHREREWERSRSLAEHSAQHDRLAKLANITIGIAIGILLEDTAMFADESRESRGPYGSGEVQVLKEQFRNIVEGLPARQRDVIRYHYYQELSFTEIADLLGLTKARISQVHCAALLELRDRFTRAGPWDEWG